MCVCEGVCEYVCDGVCVSGVYNIWSVDMLLQRE